MNWLARFHQNDSVPHFLILWMNRRFALPPGDESPGCKGGHAAADTGKPRHPRPGEGFLAPKMAEICGSLAVAK